MIGEQGSDTLTFVQRLVLLGVGASLLLAPSVFGIAAVGALGLGWWLVPKFWWTVLFGAIGGVLAGATILGVGFRLAMRIVALLDPFRAEEFTIGGTLFILIGIGAIFGGILGIVGNLAKRGLGLTSVVTASIVPALGAMSLILVSEDTRTELFELGAGAWVNIPMFGLVSILYGLGAAWITARADRKIRPKRDVAEPVEVPT